MYTLRNTTNRAGAKPLIFKDLSVTQRGFFLLIVPVTIQFALLVSLFFFSHQLDSYSAQRDLARDQAEDLRELIAAECIVLMDAESSLSNHGSAKNTTISEVTADQIAQLAQKLNINLENHPERAAALSDIVHKTGPLLYDIKNRNLMRFLKKKSTSGKISGATTGGTQPNGTGAAAPPAAANATASAAATANTSVNASANNSANTSAHTSASPAATSAASADAKAARMEFENRIVALTNQLDDLEQQEDAHAPKVDQTLLDWRQSWFLIVSIGTALNLLSILFVVMIFNRDLMQRILVINKNFSRFVEGKILEPELIGTDEIAQLDRAFRKVAGSLADAQSKEAALFHSVKSVLASVDQHGRVQEVNDAATRILGYEPHELIGSHIYDVVPGEQRKRTMDMFKTIRTSVPKPFELTVARKDDSLINTLWSLSYTAAEQKIFCVIQDISERSEAEKMRKQVLQMVSHDLRNPLSTVDVVYAILGKGNLVDFNATGRDSLSMAKAKLSTMLGLVNNLLDIEKIEAGMLDLEIVSLPTGSVFETAINQLRDEIRSKNVHIYMIGAGLSVSGDQYRLEQVMTNLLSHAVKRSPEGGNVRIAAAEERGGRVRLSVSDEGPMLSAKQRASLFSRFREPENAESEAADSAVNGAGADLSMAICKMLVELHGGQIDVKSDEKESVIFFNISAGRPSH